MSFPVRLVGKTGDQAFIFENGMVVVHDKNGIPLTQPYYERKEAGRTQESIVAYYLADGWKKP